MNQTFIFNLAFIVQILGLSVFLPKLLLSKFTNESSDSLISETAVRRYRLMNNINVVLGFLVLALLSFYPTFSSTVFTLLTIGIYFLMQMFPLIFNRRCFKHSKVQPLDQKSFTITNVVHPIFIGVAILLFLSYLTKSLIDWDGSLNTQLLQMVIFVGVNAYLLFTLRNIIREIKQATGEERLNRMASFSKAAPLFTYLSIGISAYYFGKMFLINFELNEYRPFMMSISLLAVGFIIIDTLGSGIQKEPVKNIHE
ncbi:MAG: hypothetical protein JXR03_04525 [Cyclobacteriaceae bacterium]